MSREKGITKINDVNQFEDTWDSFGITSADCKENRNFYYLRDSYTNVTLVEKIMLKKIVIEFDPSFIIFGALRKNSTILSYQDFFIQM